jgi:hypothetical protein
MIPIQVPLWQITQIGVGLTDHAGIVGEPEVGRKPGAGKFGWSALHLDD